MKKGQPINQENEPPYKYVCIICKHHTEAYLEPSRTSARDFFLRKQSTIFAKELHRRCSTGFETPGFSISLKKGSCLCLEDPDHLRQCNNTVLF